MLDRAQLLRQMGWDYRHYMRYSCPRHTIYQSRSALEGRIQAQSHVIEKGLSARDRKPAFGRAAVWELISLLKRHSELYGSDCKGSIGSALLVLYSYLEEEKDNCPDGIELENAVCQLDEMSGAGGTLSLTSDEFQSLQMLSFAEFAEARHSIRDFADKPVSREIIQQVVRLAQSAPSACNRQSPRVYVLQNKDKIRELLETQGGTRGFADLVRVAFIITTRTSRYSGAAERNLAFVDGGIFLMNMLYGLQYFGIGACPLMWDEYTMGSEYIREQLDIPCDEMVVALIGAGHVPETFKVAVSQRVKLADVLVFLNE